MGALSAHGAFSGRDGSHRHFLARGKHRKMPGEKLALAIALHYLILALRDDPGMESEIAREYCARAARWRAKACESSNVAPESKATGES
jgi:hypothetical protein